MVDAAETPPIVYERAASGWRVPEAERGDWERRRTQLFAPEAATPPKRREYVARPVQALVVEFDAAFYLERNLELDFRAFYEREPVKATRLAEHVLTEARAGRLTNPGGFLAWRLRELNANP